MESVLGILLVLLIIAGVAGAVWLYYYLQKIRRQKLAAVARELGLTYYPGGRYDFQDKYGFFELFQRGDSRRSYDLIAGYRDGIEVMMFDFSYMTGSGKNRTRHVKTACIFEFQTERYFPYVHIRPEGFFDKIASAIGFNDIDFESAEFSRKYYVKGQDRRFAYDLVHPRMMEYLLAIGSICIETANTAMLAHHDKKLSPEDWIGLFKRAEGFFGRIPERLFSHD